MSISRASFSRCRKFRYTLTRQWDESKQLACLVGLNPSTADKDSNDPTIRRCISFTQQWGFGGFIIVNLFGFKSPHPGVLKKAQDPIGPQNNIAINRTVDSTARVILMWGNHGSFRDRDLEVLQLLSGRSLYCAGMTKTGAPRHLLYVKGETLLERYVHRVSG